MQSIDDLPGKQEAESLGYTLHHYTPYRKATYVKNYLHLEIQPSPDGYSLTGTLSAYIGLVELKIDRFSFPNKNFPVFEKQISSILEICCQ